MVLVENCDGKDATISSAKRIWQIDYQCLSKPQSHLETDY